jgi:hypothetical protein
VHSAAGDLQLIMVLLPSAAMFFPLTIFIGNLVSPVVGSQQVK